jgi:subtilisin-like proprotein convertase family protein
VLAHSARKNHTNDPEWTVNGAGHDVSHKYGFGAIDAQAAVDVALGWTNVAPEVSASVSQSVNQPIPDNDPAGVVSTLAFSEPIRIEQVEVVFNATHPYRGDLRVVLTSPSGTQSILAERRDADNGANYNNWRFSSTRHWDELSLGQWTLSVSDRAADDLGTFNSWQLIIYGTETEAFDFGDAPDEPYGTLLTSDGPRHRVGGPILGWLIDAEPDGQPNADATGDGEDEDGILWIEPLVAGTTAHIGVYSSPGGGVLDYFFDFDGVGGFGNQPNEIFAATLSGGWELIPVTVPAESVLGTTFARFRISSGGELGPLGEASDGEVEDYAVTIFAEAPPRDFGDAPEPLYRTSQERLGPSHIIGGPWLGAHVDAEPDASPNATATGDEGDEDGVVFNQLLVAGQTAYVHVTSSPGGGVLDYFFDFDRDGQFGNRSDEVFRAELSGGTDWVPVVSPSTRRPA